ncbi:unnamed protein product [Rhizophagus irregularis]|nr:unnamed protein product [Rhizophagus irregularis]
MKKYRKREKPFDIKVGETKTSDEWSSVEDRFPEDEDYLVQNLSNFCYAHLNPDQDLFEIEDDLPKEIVIEDIIEDSIESENDEVEKSMGENE